MFEQQKNEIIETVKKEAIMSIKNFCRLIDLYPELFSHIYNISIIIGKTEEDAPAQYMTNENYIIINQDYIEDMIEKLNEYSNDERKKNRIITNVAVTLVHEMIHANRALMIENGLNSMNASQQVDNELINYAQHKQGHSVEQYMNLLETMIGKPYIIDFKKYIPIKVTIKSDGSYTIIAYNRETKDYDEFANQFFNTKMDNDVDKFIHNIGIELNNSRNNYKITETIYSLQDDANDQKTVIASDYYIHYNQRGKLVNDFDVSSKGISPQEYAKILDAKTNEVEDRIENANGFEEVITEALASIIVMSRNDEQLELDLITDKIIKSETSLTDERIAAKFIQRMGIDMIRWFMTSVYAEYYDDELERIFKKRYDDLLLDFNDLYEAGKYDEEPDQFSIDDINDILDEKLNRTK